MVVELIAIPLVSAILITLIRDERWGAIISTSAISTLTPYLLIILLYCNVPFTERFIEVSIHGHVEYAFILGIDSLNVVPLITVTTLMPSIYLYSYDYMKHRIRELGEGSIKLYYILMLINTSGILGVLLAHNMITFMSFYEFLVLTSCTLIYFFGYGNRGKISLTYLAWSLIGSLIILIGLASIYGYIGSFDFINFTPSYVLPSWVCYITLIGFGIKMGAVGLHLWLPPAHSEAPTPFSSVLSPIIIGLGGYGILRVLKPFFTCYDFSLILLIWGTASIIYGGLAALIENDIKRLLAYSSISQVGYLLLTLSSCSITLSTIAFSYHYLAHAYAKALLFLAAGALIYSLNNRDIRSIHGLLSKHKLVSIAFISGFLSLAGLPPFAGFNSKLIVASMLLKSSIEYGYVEIHLMTLFALASTILTLLYGIRAVRRIVFGPPLTTFSDDIPIAMKLSLIIIMMLLIITSLVPHVVIGSISLAMD